MAMGFRIGIPVGVAARYMGDYTWVLSYMVVAIGYLLGKEIEALQQRVAQLEADLLGVIAGDIPDRYLDAMERLREMRERSRSGRPPASS